jgi:hypothetical protein
MNNFKPMTTTIFLTRFVLGSLFVLCLFTAAFSQPATGAAGKADTEYGELLAKVKKGDFTIDFKALRFAFAKKSEAGISSADIKAHADMVKALNERKYKDAINIAEGIQKTAFVDMNSHVVAAMSYQGLGDAKKAKYHEAVYLGLVNSILKDADGNSTKTAYVVISPAEEYVLLNALDLSRGTRELITEEGRSYSIQTAIDKSNNQQVKIYFNIDAANKVALKANKD